MPSEVKAGLRKRREVGLETRFRLLRALQANPQISQRELAEQLGVSLGKVNYCLEAVIKKGWIKASNFARSKNKRGYIYQLTPSGLAEKAQITSRFLRRKIREHEELTREIDRLKRELGTGTQNETGPGSKNKKLSNQL